MDQRMKFYVQASKKPTRNGQNKEGPTETIEGRK
jgi:hypothetical protein